MLSATVHSLSDVRTALVQGDLRKLTTALEQQTHTARAAEELRLRRAQLRREIAAHCGSRPESASLQMLASRIPGELGEQLANYRGRLKSMASQADRLNRGNAILIRQSVNFLQHLLAGLTGTDSDPHIYNPHGPQRSLACGAIIEGEG